MGRQVERKTETQKIREKVKNTEKQEVREKETQRDRDIKYGKKEY